MVFERQQKRLDVFGKKKCKKCGREIKRELCSFCNRFPSSMAFVIKK